MNSTFLVKYFLLFKIKIWKILRVCTVLVFARAISSLNMIPSELELGVPAVYSVYLYDCYLRIDCYFSYANALCGFLNLPLSVYIILNIHTTNSNQFLYLHFFFEFMNMVLLFLSTLNLQYCKKYEQLFYI